MREFTCQPGQVLVLEGGIEIEVLAVRGNQVSLGVTAPRPIAVHRKEVADTLAPETKPLGNADKDRRRAAVETSDRDKD